MFLQPCLHQPNKLHISSPFFYSSSIPHFPFPQTLNFQKFPATVVTCSISQVHNHGTADFEKKPNPKWNELYKRISLMEKPQLGAATVLDQWDKDGKNLSRWELNKIVKELRRFKRHKSALEVYEWMHNRRERFKSSSSEAAIQLDLIAQVYGVSTAEDFFMKLPDDLKDKKIFGSLLNAYTRARIKEKAEALMNDMRNKGYVTHNLPFNVMMTMYMNLGEYDKVELIIAEMLQKRVKLDTYSYNIWLSCRGSQGSAEKMEQVYEKMMIDITINPSWTTFSTMATLYMKLGLLDKAQDCLKNVESRITGRDRIAYHYLISLYGSLGNREEVYRVWNIYKSIFFSVPNLGYHSMIASLIRVKDVEGAEMIYNEWLRVKSTFDARLCNLLIAWYMKDGKMEKATSFFNQMLELGGKPNSSSWEILVDGHTRARRISEALSCWKEAFATEGSNKWKAKPASIRNFFKLCDDEGDTESKEVLLELLRQFGYFEDKSYSLLTDVNKLPIEKVITDLDENEDEASNLLISQLQNRM